MSKKRDIVQAKNPKSGHYVKIDRTTGIILSHKKSVGPYKGIPVSRKSSGVFTHECISGGFMKIYYRSKYPNSVKLVTECPHGMTIPGKSEPRHVGGGYCNDRCNSQCDYFQSEDRKEQYVLCSCSYARYTILGEHYEA